MHMIQSVKIGLVFVLASVFGFSGCGGGDSSGSTTEIDNQTEEIVVLNEQCTPIKAQINENSIGNLQPFTILQESLNITESIWDGTSTRVLDFDGDGDDDLIRLEYSFPFSQTYSGSVTILENQNGTLIESTAEWIVPDHPRDFAIADFDGDGKEEMFVAQHGYDAEPFPGAPNLLLKYENNRLIDAGSSNIVTNESNGFTHGAAHADVDCDGDIDIFTVDAGSADVDSHLLINNQGIFTIKEQSIPDDFIAGYQESTFIDFDLDGDPDLFMGASSSVDQQETTLLVNDGFGNFKKSSQVSLPSPNYTPSHGINSVQAADFTGDGYPDLLLFEISEPFSTRSAIRLWENQKDGSFIDITAKMGLPVECTGEVIEPLFVEDFNNDGWMDFIIPLGCEETGSAPAIAINTGTGFHITNMTSFRSWFEYATPYPIDIDSDGDLDLYLDQGGGPVLLENSTIVK